MAEEVEEHKLVSFEHANGFLSSLQVFVQAAAPNAAAASSATAQDADADRQTSHRLEETYNTLASTLDIYQEQNYLLDPFLERMVAPVAVALRASVQELITDVGVLDSKKAGREDGLHWLSKLMYFYTKVRGHKIITHFFPHEVDDLLPVITLLESSVDVSVPGQSQRLSWEMRYTLLLWLSLVCMIPFDLKNFDAPAHGAKKAPTADRIVNVAKHFLASSGKERDASVLVLAKLFQRTDAADQLDAYLRWCEQSLCESQREPSITFLATGVLFSLCELLKVLNPDKAESILPQLQTLLSVINAEVAAGTELRRNALIAKGKTKLSARIALKLLKPRRLPSLAQRGVRAKPLMAGEAPLPQPAEDEDADGADVPEEVDQYIGELLDSLSHQDTMVRYSAAKGLARICTRLPPPMVPQITEAIVSLFPINVLTMPDGSIDLSAASEHTWQGACLALAELARRGMLSTDSVSGTHQSAAAQYELDEQLMWVQRALSFDPRRGAHSIGSGVRDAACYVIWALARANDENSIRPHAESLAANLVCVACTDREVSIRRAASAAFQEGAGRLGIFPHGLDIIRKADFFAVGVRRRSFLEVLPSVAEHSIYRMALVERLQKVSLAHWDLNVRELAANSLARVIQLQPEQLLTPTIQAQLESPKDQFVAHGRLLALAALGPLCARADPKDESGRRGKALDRCCNVMTSRRTTSLAPRLVEACCQVIAQTYDARIPSHHSRLSAIENIIESALSMSDAGVHEAASKAVHTIASRFPTWNIFSNVVKRWSSFPPAQQQGWSLACGQLSPIDADAHRVASFLCHVVTKDHPHFSRAIEARRNACLSIGQLFAQREWTQDTLAASCAALLSCVDDYTVDQRGDVGSWVRTAAMQSLASICEQHGSTDGVQAVLLPFRCACLKQAAEKIDSVRACAAECLQRGTAKNLRASESQLGTFLADAHGATDLQLRDADWMLARVVPFLGEPKYRAAVLSGLLNSIGSKADITRQSVASALRVWLSSESLARVSLLLTELHHAASSNFSSNKVFVPAVEAVNILFDSDLSIDEWSSLSQQLEQIGKVAFRSIDKVKSLPRLQACSDLSIRTLSHVRLLRTQMVAQVCSFLQHTLPTVRQTASERLYMVLADLLPEDGDNETAEAALQAAEEVLLETPWVSVSKDQHAAEAEILRGHLTRLIQAGEHVA